MTTRLIMIGTGPDRAQINRQRTQQEMGNHTYAVRLRFVCDVSCHMDSLPRTMLRHRVLCSARASSSPTARHGPVDLSHTDVSQLTEEQIMEMELGFFKRLNNVDTTRDVRVMPHALLPQLTTAHSIRSSWISLEGDCTMSIMNVRLI
jgi:hypothetical protein